MKTIHLKVSIRLELLPANYEKITIQELIEINTEEDLIDDVR